MLINMNNNRWNLLLVFICLLHCSLAPPVEKKKQEEKTKDAPDFNGIEYKNYLQEVVDYLEKDEAFASILKNATEDDIKSGNIARKISVVGYDIRSKLDEAKRMEIERLKKAALAQMERNEIGLYRGEDSHKALSSPDGRHWRTVGRQQIVHGGGGGSNGDPWLDRLGRPVIPMPNHLDIHNPHSFEEQDLRKLIESSTRDLEALDRQQREEFKRYEMEKEHKYREKLKQASEDQRKVLVKEHEDLIEQQKHHPRIHHPGSKAQLEQVWEEQDHLPKEEFDPLVFFSTHDIDGNGFLDPQEVEAVVAAEVKQAYEGEGKKADPVEEREEIRRMREHIFNETDKDKNGVISWNEFLKMTQGPEFDRDEGWQPIIDTDQRFTDEEFRQFEYEQQHQQPYGMHDPRQMGVQYAPQYGLPQGQQYHPQGVPIQHPQEAHQGYQVQGVPPHPGQGMPPQGVPPHPGQGIPPQGVPPHPGQGMPLQGVPPHPGQGMPLQGVPPHPGQGMPPQGVPPHPGQGMPLQGLPPHPGQEIPPQGLPSHPGQGMQPQAPGIHSQHQYAAHQQVPGASPYTGGQHTRGNQPAPPQQPPVPGNVNAPHH